MTVQESSRQINNTMISTETIHNPEVAVYEDIDNNYDDIYMSHSHNYTNWTCSTETHEFGQWMKFSVSISSVLSIFGALLVILTVCMKPPSKKPTNEDRGSNQQLDRVSALNATGYGSTVTLTRTTQSGGDGGNNDNQANNTTRKFCTNFRVVKRPAVFILISISVADILVAVSHLWGVLSSYEYTLSHHKNHTRYDYAECGAQALVAVFGTISSLLWSDVLMFMAIVMLWCKQQNVKRLISVHAFVVYNFIGWVVPFLVVMILGAGVDAFGFAEGIGRCLCGCMYVIIIMCIIIIMDAE